MFRISNSKFGFSLFVLSTEAHKNTSHAPAHFICLLMRLLIDRTNGPHNTVVHEICANTMHPVNACLIWFKCFMQSLQTTWHILISTAYFGAFRPHFFTLTAYADCCVFDDRISMHTLHNSTYNGTIMQTAVHMTVEVSR